jgi:hypothetical protein
MLTSKPQKKKRGRQPPDYGPRVCPLCVTKLKIANAGTFYCPNVTKCGWKE